MPVLTLSKEQQEHNNAVAIARLEERLENLQADMKKVVTQVEELTSTSARVKGGIFVVLMLSGIAGWIVTISSAIWHFFH